MSPVGISVRGGTCGLEIAFESVLALAREYAGVGQEALTAARSLSSYFGGSLTSARSLDPSGCARATEALEIAVSGTDGLTGVAQRAGKTAIALNNVVAKYRLNEERVLAPLYDVQRLLTEEGPLDYLGNFFGGVWSGAGRLLSTGNPLEAGQVLLNYELELGADLNEMLPSGSTEILTNLLGELYDDSDPVVSPVCDTRSASGVAPRGFADLIGGLARRNDGPDNEIDVTVITHADDTRNVVVNIPGSTTFDPFTLDPTALGADLRAIEGKSTTYERGVFEAMRQAGVRPDDSVMLVGHSLGGMVAVNAASRTSGQFRITHVVTAGSPVGRTATSLPSSVRLLALENERDKVHSLDGEENPMAANVTTVVGEAGDDTFTGNHDLHGAYTPIAEGADASGDGSIRDFAHSAAGFLAGGNFQTQVFHIGRR